MQASKTQHMYVHTAAVDIVEHLKSKAIAQRPQGVQGHKQHGHIRSDLAHVEDACRQDGQHCAE